MPVSFNPIYDINRFGLF